MSLGVLIDTTKCIGCRSCQVSCKLTNGLPAEKTQITGHGGFQNPRSLSAKTLTLITNKEVEDPNSPGGLKWVFAKRQCMHCDDPACVSACPVTALHKTKAGPVVYDSGKCMGCRYCVWACPFGVPTADWDSLAPEIHKCDMCFGRISNGKSSGSLNGLQVSPEVEERFAQSNKLPSCVKACLTGALKFGDRNDLLTEARERINSHPGKYVSHIFGEKEAGGTSTLYLAAVPFEKLGFDVQRVGIDSYPHISKVAMGFVSPLLMGLGGIFTAVYLLKQRKEEIASVKEQGKKE